MSRRGAARARRWVLPPEYNALWNRPHVVLNSAGVNLTIGGAVPMVRLAAPHRPLTHRTIASPPLSSPSQPLGHFPRNSGTAHSSLRCTGRNSAVLRIICEGIGACLVQDGEQHLFYAPIQVRHHSGPSKPWRENLVLCEAKLQRG